MKSLCGTTKVSQRIVSRAIKKCVVWERSNWSTSVDTIKDDPLCGQMLLDKLLRQYHGIDIFFIADICNGHNRKDGESVGFSIADVYFLAVLLKWFVVYFRNSISLPPYLESILVYINHVRFQLQQLFNAFQSTILESLTNNLLFISIDKNSQEIFPPFLRWSFTQSNGNGKNALPVAKGHSTSDFKALSIKDTTVECGSLSRLLDEIIPSLVQSIDWSSSCHFHKSNSQTLK